MPEKSAVGVETHSPHYTKPTNASLAARADAAKDLAPGPLLDLSESPNRPLLQPRNRHRFAGPGQTEPTTRDLSALKGEKTPPSSNRNARWEIKYRNKEEHPVEAGMLERPPGQLFLGGQPCVQHERQSQIKANIQK